jgi:hypothetical protein
MELRAWRYLKILPTKPFQVKSFPQNAFPRCGSSVGVRVYSVTGSPRHCCHSWPSCDCARHTCCLTALDLWSVFCSIYYIFGKIVEIICDEKEQQSYVLTYSIVFLQRWEMPSSRDVCRLLYRRPSLGGQNRNLPVVQVYPREVCRAYLSPYFLTSFNLISVHLMKLISSSLISYNLCSRCNLCFFIFFCFFLFLLFLFLWPSYLLSFRRSWYDTFFSSLLIYMLVSFYSSPYRGFFILCFLFLTFFHAVHCLFGDDVLLGHGVFVEVDRRFRGVFFSIIRTTNTKQECSVFLPRVTCTWRCWTDWDWIGYRGSVQYLWTNLICTFYIKNKTNFARSLKMLYWERFSNTK